jgi:AcrR family transcriptional regulator
MPRPRKYDDSAILEAAAAEFLENGAGASTARIAGRAGVSEGILFQRFKTKEALFEAAMTAEPGSNLWRKTLLDRVGMGVPEDNLREAILALLKKLEKVVPKLMVLEGQGARRPPHPGRKAPPLEDAATIATYLSREAKCGRLSLDHFDLHAHEIVGAVMHYTMIKVRHQVKVASPKRLAEHLVAVHLGGRSNSASEDSRTK